jgi:hypothetical protein
MKITKQFYVERVNPKGAHVALLSCLLMITMMLTTPVYSRQLGDVDLPDSVTLEGTDQVLQLNGMGYRTKFVFKVYVAALYTQSKADSRDEVQSLDGPKRIVMHMVYDEVSREKMNAAWLEGFEENNTDEQFDRLKSRLETFIALFPDLKAGDVIYLDYLPSSGTQVVFNGEKKPVIEGADFYTALLDVWLGEDPADDDLKDALLGVTED